MHPDRFFASREERKIFSAPSPKPCFLIPWRYKPDDGSIKEQEKVIKNGAQAIILGSKIQGLSLKSIRMAYI